MIDAEVIREFEDAMRGRGIVIPSGGVVADGKLRRCDAEGKNGKNDAAYLMFPDDPPVGGFENWRDGRGWENWRGNGTGRRLSSAEEHEVRAKWEAARKAREQVRTEKQMATATEARQRWNAARLASADYTYLQRKGIGPLGLKLDGEGWLLVPMRDANGELWNLQKIAPDGEKRFLPGGRTEGLCFLSGPKIDPDGTVVIGEGMATMKSVNDATGFSVAAAMSAGNLLPVGKALREKFPKVRIVCFADHDKSGVGLKAAQEAARVTGGLVVMPPKEGDDANDLYIREGAEAVKKVLDAARPVELPTIDTTQTEKVSATPILEPFRPTDLWNAQLFVHLHGDKVRYCDRMGGWFHYDGKRWARADGGEIERLAKETVRHLYELAALEPDTERRQAIARYAARSEAAGKLTAMLELARTEEGIIVSPDAFDSDPFKFNVQNGTLVIDPINPSITLASHRPEDLITNISPAQWRGIDAQGRVFNAYLEQSANGDQELIAFRRRMAGYAVTADMREQVFEYAFGPEAGGKGTETRARADVMGTYARAAEIVTFLTSRSDKVRNDLAGLVGARLVTATETQEGQVLDEGLIRMLTGQDRMTARFLFKENFEFSCGFKIRFEGNHRPTIKSCGGATWRRLLIVPFEKTVPEEQRDRLLGEKLKSPEERAGILAWMARGCLEWLGGGLRPPDKVRAAVAEYRAAEDRIAPFLEECCETNYAGAVPAGRLYSRYKDWAEGNGERPISKRSFGLRLEEKGFQSGRGTGGVRTWFGMVLFDGREPGDE